MVGFVGLRTPAGMGIAALAALASLVGTSPVAAAPPVKVPDLAVKSMSILGPNTQYAFNSVAIVQNLGKAPVDLGPVTIQAYYSPDTELDVVNDLAACSYIATGTLKAHQSVEVRNGCSATPRAGDRYLLVVVDYSNNLRESDETNNISYVSLP